MLYDRMNARKFEAAKRDISFHQNSSKYYVVTLAVNPKNLLDIYKAKELEKTFYREKDMVIAGVALDMEGAQDVAVRLLEDVYRKTGGFDVRKYYSPGLAPTLVKGGGG